MIIQYIEGLYVCDMKTSYDKNIYKKLNINIIINFSVDYPFVDLDVKKTRIPISDSLNYHTDIELIKNNLTKILKYIYDNYINYNILLCCHDGLTITPIIIGLFIHKYGKIPISSIKKILKSKNDKIDIECDLNIFI